MKSSLGCQLRYDTIFARVTIVAATPREKATCKTKFAQVESTMITFAKVQVPSRQYPFIIVMIRKMALGKHVFIPAKHEP
jgi:hypothetical protein